MRVRVLAAVLLTASLLVLPRAAQAAPTTRVLITGDSITQGSGGDWTWRYRLWQHLDATAPGRVDLVGPSSTLYDNERQTFDSTAYLDPAFDRDHAARWGGAYRDVGQEIGGLVEGYQPDVVVDALGTNDLGYHGESADQVEARLRAFVAAARAARPGVDLVLVSVPDRVGDAAAYDARLAGVAADLDTDSSRVVVADIGAFLSGDETYDGLHPSARGELRIAAAVADALAGLGIGSAYPRPLPEVPVGPRQAAALWATAGDGSVSLSWFSAPSVTEEWVWLRDLTTGETWWRLPERAPRDSRLVVANLVPGHDYAFMLQPRRWNLDAASDVRSNVVEARPLGTPPSPSPSPTPSPSPSPSPTVTVTATATATATATVTALPTTVPTAVPTAAPSPPPGTRPPVVRFVSVRSPARDRVVTRARAVTPAEDYQVALAPSTGCDRRPPARAFRVVASGVVLPRATVRTRAAYAWVRWRARLGTTLSPVRRASSACTRVR
jgi:lysophospholipase L1-like esterase